MQTKICFIGAGNMAQSLIGGLIASDYPKDKLMATDPNADIQKIIIEQFGIDCISDNHQAIAQSDIVVLAVKPQILQNVCQNIAESIQAQKPLILSVAAGIKCEAIERWLGGDLSIVRTMPNTPALIQTGATGLFANDKVDDEQKSQSEHIMRAAGVTLWVNDEAQLDVVTALSGSGPAYYFLFMEAMEQAAVKMGLDEKSAHLLTMQTALGAAKMVMESRQDCATLRKNVTSPNGTTEKAIQSFESADLRGTIETAMKQAQLRAAELAEELGED
ncbi:pyrroline-5-carboxylate reductase [Thiomicrorhabdus indica]|uniref:pyrroline-5-carboxylate reductase n=1 Tax=Thiomicrorhabdus indica TaxID=2267253 RepID=UPI002AA629CF|nr:pyrroline-5-carboxylate reductase [Thiomicrorhabdus indica]